MLIALLCPPSVGVRRLAALRIGHDVAAVYGYNLTEIGQVLFKDFNGPLHDVPYQPLPSGQLGHEAAVGGLSRDSVRIQTADEGQRGVIGEIADEGGDGGDVQDIASQVATPEGFYGVALAATMDFACERTEEFGVIKAIEHSLQLGDGRWDLPCRATDFNIERSHLVARPTLWSEVVGVSAPSASF